MTTIPTSANAIVPVGATTTPAPVSQPQATQPQTGPATRTTSTATTQPRAATLPPHVMQASAPPSLPQVGATSVLQAYYPDRIMQGLDARGQSLVAELQAPGPRDWHHMQYAQHATHSALRFTMGSSRGDTLDVGLRIERGQVVGMSITNRNTGDTVNASCQAAPSANAQPQRPILRVTLAIDAPLPPQLQRGLTNTELRLVADLLQTPASQRSLHRYNENGGQTTFEFSVRAARSAATGGPASFHVSGSVRFGQIENCTVTERNANQSVTMPVPAPATVPLGQQAQQTPTGGQPVPVANLAALFAAQPPMHGLTQTQPILLPGQGAPAPGPGANGRFTIANAVVSHCFRGIKAGEWNANGVVDNWCLANNNAPRGRFIDAVVAAANALALHPGATSGPNPPMRQAQAGPPEIWRFDLPDLDNRTLNQTVPAYIGFTDATLSQVADVRTLVAGRSEAQLLQAMTLRINRP